MFVLLSFRPSLSALIRSGDRDHNRIKEHRIMGVRGLENNIRDLLVTCGTRENLNINHVTDFVNGHQPLFTGQSWALHLRMQKKASIFHWPRTERTMTKNNNQRRK